jgi:fluoroacetyl-CoA thioesterase
MDFTNNIPLGSEAHRETIVTPEVTVRYAYPDLPEVYATPHMIYLMEIAAADAIVDFLPQGWGSVGTLVDVRHISATPVKIKVSAFARVVEINQMSIRFYCEAADEMEIIGRGFHERAIVPLDTFVTRVQQKFFVPGDKQ